MRNKQALILMLSANVVSGFAQGITVIAIPWYFINTLKADSLFGAIFMAVTIATLFWSLYAGTLIDRYPRKRVFLFLNVAGVVIQGLIAAFGYYLGASPIWLVTASFTFTIFVFNVHYPAIYAFAQEISEAKNYGKINSLLEVQGQATSMAAGGFAAILLAGTSGLAESIQAYIPFSIVPWEMHEIIALDAITYGLAFCIIIAIKHKPITALAPDTSSIITRLRMGFSYLRQHPMLYVFGLASYAVFIVLIVEGFYLLPMYVDHHLQEGAGVLALGEVAYSLGALAAGMGIRLLFAKRHPYFGIVVLMLFTIFVLLWLVFTKSVLVFVAFSLGMGLANAGVRVLRITFLFNHIPNHIIGRTTGIFSSFNILIRSLLIGIFALPFFGIGNNVIWSYAACALVVFLGLIPILIIYPRISKLEEVAPAKQ